MTTTPTEFTVLNGDATVRNTPDAVCTPVTYTPSIVDVTPVPNENDIAWFATEPISKETAVDGETAGFEAASFTVALSPNGVTAVNDARKRYLFATTAIR
jgi:hypothetical protein